LKELKAIFRNFEYIEKILGKKIDILTPEGVKSIIIKRISENIEKSITYV
jgi:predicted nucleotidyltransferase